MAAITLKNLPARLHRALRHSAERNRRSLNAEIISRLETSIGSQRVDVGALLERARRLRESLEFETNAEEIDRAKRQGRR